MIRRGAIACSLSWIVTGATAVAADPGPSHPTSLRMRPGTRLAAPAPRDRAGKHVAQAATPDPPPADGTPPAEPDETTPPPASPEPAPAPRPEPKPPAPTSPAADLSDADFAKLADQDYKEEVIIVTGSTIGRRSVTTPAPVTILDRELLTASGQATLGDIIQQLPAQQNGVNAQINVGGEGSTRVDLRGVGSARTLVLVNGRRIVPSGIGANVSVDLNTIPLAIVERVEVLKDGASAIYGSDAIGGVVNIITRSDFDGSEASFYTSGTQHGDGLAYDASFVTGYNSDNKKGNLVFSTGVQNQRPVFAGDRAFAANDMTYDYANRQVIRGGSTAAPGGRINTNAIDLTGDGRPDPVDLCGAQYCTSSGAGGYRPFISPDDLYNYQPLNYLYTPSTRYHFFSAGSYKLTPHISTFFEGTYTNRKSEQQLASETFTNAAPISKDSMYNPIGGTILGYQRRLEEFGPRVTSQNINTFRIIAGLKGKIPDDSDLFKNFQWEVSYNHGHNDAEQKNQGNLIKSRLAYALGPSFMSAAGVPTCGTPTKPIAGCVPMNILGPSGSIDPAAASYVTFTGIRSGFNEQQSGLAQAHGRLAALPNNGDLSLALGGGYRQESAGTTPDPLTATGDTTGSSVAPTTGSYNVAEAFGELSLVPISGHPIAQWVELDVAARAFRYNTSGSGVTWKAGGLFRTVNGFAVRGTYSTSFRSPSVVELYQGKADAFLPVVDPCDTRPLGTPIMLDPEVAAQCASEGVPTTAAFGAALTRMQLGGNPRLKPETASVATAGIVFEPPQAKGLTLTVDFSRIQIVKAIQVLGANTILANCYTRHVQSACDEIHRNPQLGNSIDYIDLPYANTGGASGTGIDVALGYDHALGGAGRFREQLESQYLIRADLDNTYQVLHGLGNNDLGARPRVRATYSSLWQHPSGIGAGFNLRFVGTFKECEQNNCNGGMPSRDVDRWYKADVFASYSARTAAGTTSLTIGANNVLDRSPPPIYGLPFGDYDGTAYDLKGRLFYARMSQTF